MSKQIEYIRKYNQALKEIWDTPITSQEADLKVLEAHGLGTVKRKEYNINGQTWNTKFSFKFNQEILDLD